MKRNTPVHHTRRDLVDELISLVVQNSGEPAHLAPVRILRLALLLHLIVPEVHHADLPRLIDVRVGGDEDVKLLVSSALAGRIRRLGLYTTHDVILIAVYERELKETHHRAADPRVGIVARARRDLRPALALEPARLVRLPAAPADDGAVHPHVTPAVVLRVGECGAVVVALFGRIL